MNIPKIVDKSIDLYNKGNYKESYNILKKLLNKNIDIKTLSIIYYNMGLCKSSTYEWESALRSYKKSESIGGDSQYEIFLCLMHLNRLDEAKSYWKFRCEGIRKSYPDLPISRLKFGDDSCSILVLNEQGFGDEILFSRQIEYLSKKYKKVSYQVYDESIDFFKKYFQFENVTFFTERTLSYEFVMDHGGFILTGDFFFDLMNQNYKVLPNDRDKKWDIGFCWSANSKSKNTNERSIDPNSIKDKIVDKKIVSLQYGQKLDYTDYTEINNLLDTSEIILQCKEIWTIDTVVAHLALTLGKNVKLIKREYLDWRWTNGLYDNFEIIQI
jgi:tetratricopeptide (TPR) repeat protein